MSESERRRLTFVLLGTSLPVAIAVAIALGSVVLPLRSVASSIASGLGMP